MRRDEELFLQLASNPLALMNALDLTLTHGTMPAAMKQIITAAKQICWPEQKGPQPEVAVTGVKAFAASFPPTGIALLQGATTPARSEAVQQLMQFDNGLT